MAWSYRPDRSDEFYAGGAGPSQVGGGAKLADAQGAAPAGGDPAIYAGDGAIAVKSHNGIITKGSAAALTLAAPTVNGILIRLTSTTAFAHVITATGLLNDGLTGAPHNTFTFTAFPGGSVELLSFGGLWQLIAKN